MGISQYDPFSKRRPAWNAGKQDGAQSGDLFDPPAGLGFGREHPVQVRNEHAGVLWLRNEEHHYPSIELDQLMMSFEYLNTALRHEVAGRKVVPRHRVQSVVRADRLEIGEQRVPVGSVLVKTGRVTQIDHRPGLVRQHGLLKRPAVHGIHRNDENMQIGKSGRVE